MNNTIEKKENNIQNEQEANKQSKENKTRKIVIKILVTLILIITLLILLSIILNEELLHLGEGIYNNIINGTVNNVGNNNVGGPSGGSSGGGSTGGETNIVIPPSVDITDDYILNYFRVVSEGIVWSTEQEINIFDNRFYSDSIIAPGVNGQYDFTVENTGEKLVNYNFVFEELNNKNINLQYKIKMNGEYIIDKWTRIQNISLPSYELQPYTNANYTIEWEWIDAENDTSIGMDSQNASYILKININTQTTSV